MEQTLNGILNQLVEFVKAASQFTWTMAMKQVYAKAISDIVISVLLLIIIAVFLSIASNLKKKEEKKDAKYEEIFEKKEKITESLKEMGYSRSAEVLSLNHIKDEYSETLKILESEIGNCSAMRWGLWIVSFFLSLPIFINLYWIVMRFCSPEYFAIQVLIELGKSLK